MVNFRREFQEATNGVKLLPNSTSPISKLKCCSFNRPLSNRMNWVLKAIPNSVGTCLHHYKAFIYNNQSQLVFSCLSIGGFKIAST